MNYNYIFETFEFFYKKNRDKISSPVKIHITNCYVHLNGSLRFVNYPEWGEILLKLRKGKPQDANNT